MKTTLFQKTALVVSGLTAVAIGSAILLLPRAFYGSYGITLGADPSLMSEIRAPGGALAMIGFLILAGLVRKRFAQASLTLGAGLYLAWGTSRIVSLGLDGVPDSGLIWATVLELAIGTACLLALRKRHLATPETNAAVLSV